MGPEGNYKQYRHIESEADPPFIPFFGMTLLPLKKVIEESKDKYFDLDH